MSIHPLHDIERRAAPEWRGMTWLRASTELLLGISFFITMTFGGLGALRGQTSIVAELGAIVFICSLVCVLVNWFTAPAEDDDRRGWEY